MQLRRNRWSRGATIRQRVDEARAAADGDPTGAVSDGERAAVTTALRLGWWMADTYHYTQHQHRVPGGRDATAPRKLSNLTEMAPRLRLRMYLDGVDTALREIGAQIRTPAAAPATAAARELADALDRDGTATEAVLLALDALNVEVLRWTMASNYRLGLAYRLGRSLADTARDCGPEQLVWRFGGRHQEICRWLDELASVLPPFAAPVVGRSVQAWATRVRQAHHDPDRQAELTALAGRLREQGALWQDVLTGGLDPRDLLDEGNYAAIARNLLSRDRRLVRQAARGVFLPVLVPLLLFLGGIVTIGAVTAAGSPLTRTAIALAGIGAGLAGLWRTVSRPALALAREVNRPLLAIELITEMARCVTRPLRTPAPPADTPEPVRPAQSAPAASPG